MGGPQLEDHTRLYQTEHLVVCLRGEQIEHVLGNSAWHGSNVNKYNKNNAQRTPTQ